MSTTPTLPDESTISNWLSEARTVVQGAASLVDADEVEVRIYSSTGQVEVIYRNQAKPGMADGTAGTPDAPDEVRTADMNANTDLGRTLANGFRDRGADVEMNNPGQSVIVRATFAQ